MKARLHITQRDNVADYSVGRRFRFAVIDLDKGNQFPLNFVCMLPLRVGSPETRSSKFSELFGAESLTVAKKLLRNALKTEINLDFKKEIMRRLKLLEPKSSHERVCASCGDLFQVNAHRGRKQKFCNGCIRKKFGMRL